MLRASDYHSLEMMTPIFGGNADSSCRNSRPAPASAVFLSKFDFSNLLNRRSMRPGLTDEELNLLKEKVKSFKNLAREHFEIYAGSKMRILKYHALHHIVESLCDVGRLQYFLPR